MIVSLIVAVGNNNEIGKDGNLLWHLPNDMQRFKLLTTGHSIVMGRRTFDSLPKGALPNRRNIVITRNAGFHAANIEVFDSIDLALIRLRDEDEVFIIGGAQIYEQTIPFADRIYLTRIYQNFPDADTFFPHINMHEWKETKREFFSADEKNQFSYSFLVFERVK